MTGKLGNVINTCIAGVLQLFPGCCIVCGSIACHEANICQACHNSLPRLINPCLRCGIPVESMSATENLCAQCQLSPPMFDFCRGVFQYQTPIAELLSGFKFNARFDAGQAMGLYLAQTMKDFYTCHEQPQILLPVPLHRKRLCSRGYNQAVEIAKIASAYCRIPVHRSAVIRIKDTHPQTHLQGVRARQKNLLNAFSVHRQSLENVKSIAIIDDVVTTMATVSMLSQALKHQGVERIEIWCVARANR